MGERHRHEMKLLMNPEAEARKCQKMWENVRKCGEQMSRQGLGVERREDSRCVFLRREKPWISLARSTECSEGAGPALQV